MSLYVDCAGEDFSPILAEQHATCTNWQPACAERPKELARLKEMFNTDNTVVIQLADSHRSRNAKRAARRAMKQAGTHGGCGCQTDCKSRRCSCVAVNRPCTASCTCKGSCCKNRVKRHRADTAGPAGATPQPCSGPAAHSVDQANSIREPASDNDPVVSDEEGEDDDGPGGEGDAMDEGGEARDELLEIILDEPDVTENVEMMAADDGCHLPRHRLKLPDFITMTLRPRVGQGNRGFYSQMLNGRK